jgi:hypothetical protein
MNTNRKLSVTKSQYDTEGVPSVAIDLQYRSGDTLLTLSLAEPNLGTLKSRESLIKELEAEWNGFLKVLQDERLIYDSCSKETTGAQVSTNKGTLIGPTGCLVNGPLGQYQDLG